MEDGEWLYSNMSTQLAEHELCERCVRFLPPDERNRERRGYEAAVEALEGAAASHPDDFLWHAKRIEFQAAAIETPVVYAVGGLLLGRAGAYARGVAP